MNSPSINPFDENLECSKRQKKRASIKGQRLSLQKPRLSILSKQSTMKSHRGSIRTHRDSIRTHRDSIRMNPEEFEESFTTKAFPNNHEFFQEVLKNQNESRNASAAGHLEDQINPLKFGLRKSEGGTGKLKNIEHEKLDGMVDFTQKGEEEPGNENDKEPEEPQNELRAQMDQSPSHLSDEEEFRAQIPIPKKFIGFKFLQSQIQKGKKSKLRDQPAYKHLRCVLFPDDGFVRFWMCCRMM